MSSRLTRLKASSGVHAYILCRFMRAQPQYLAEARHVAGDNRPGAHGTASEDHLVPSTGPRQSSIRLWTLRLQHPCLEPHPRPPATGSILPTMDAYPAEYLQHNLPYIVLSGLGEAPQEDGKSLGSSTSPLLLDDAPHIFSDLPPVTSEVAQQLRECFLKANADVAAWDGRAHRSHSWARSMAFTMKVTGRVSLVLLHDGHCLIYPGLQTPLPQGQGPSALGHVLPSRKASRLKTLRPCTRPSLP